MIDKIIKAVRKDWCRDTDPEKVLKSVLNARFRLAAVWVSGSTDLLLQEFDRRGGYPQKPRIKPPTVTDADVKGFVAAAAQALFPGLSGYSVKTGMYQTVSCGPIADITVKFLHKGTSYTVYGDDGNSHDIDYGEE